MSIGVPLPAATVSHPDSNAAAGNVRRGGPPDRAEDAIDAAIAPFAFDTAQPDRADRLRDDPVAIAALWPQASVLLIDDDGHARAIPETHAAGAAELWLPRGAALAARQPDDAIFLALHEGRAWFALPLDAARAATLPALPDTRLDLRAAGLLLPAPDAGLFAYARALLHWQRMHRYCGRCGGALRHGYAGHRAQCNQCGLEHHPRTDAAIIVAVSDGERLLLGRQASWAAKRYSVVAGFVEPGERLEDAVVREVMEEAGVRVRSCRYLASQPWPFPANLMVGFEADAEPDEPRFGTELEDARWFSAADIHRAVAAGELLLSPGVSISRWLIERWLARHG